MKTHGVLAALLCCETLAVDDGIYRIQPRSSTVPLKAHDLPFCGYPVDKSVSVRDPVPDDYQLFKFSSVGDGSFRVSVVPDGRLLHANDLGDFQVGTIPSDVEDDYTHFEIKETLLGGYHITTTASGRAWSLDDDGLLKTSSGSGDIFKITQAEPGPSPSQGRGCFRDIVWSREEIQIVEYIEFGSSVNPVTGKTESLHLDAYLPPDSDGRKLRPAAVLVHGGGFVGNVRNCDGQPEFAMQLAQRGFLAVSIDYRQLGAYFDMSKSEEPALAATEDARAAVRFLRKVAKEYRIDTDRILMEGDSAGAGTSLYHGYVTDAQGEGESGNPGYSSQVRVEIAVSGELRSQTDCSQIHPVAAGCAQDGDIDHVGDIGSRADQPALFMIHGTEDYTVPYANAKAVFDAAQSAGVASAMVTLEGARHVPWTEFYAEVDHMDQMLDFLYTNMDLEHSECPHGSSFMV